MVSLLVEQSQLPGTSHVGSDGVDKGRHGTCRPETGAGFTFEIPDRRGGFIVKGDAVEIGLAGRNRSEVKQFQRVIGRTDQYTA